MPPIMILGTSFITLALVFYTIGVWSERLAGRLKGWHVILFWLGLACDATGTALMVSDAGGLKADMHGVTGFAAILLMAVNSYFYFCAHYIVAGPYAILPSFEHKFVRLTYIGGGRFSLAAMRHTEEWMEIFPDLTLDECLASIRDDPWFHP